MTASRMLILALVAQPLLAQAASTEAAANPIRKVVTMLQKMQSKVEAENEAEKELHEKFMCYCKTGAGDLQASIDAANTKIPQVSSDIKEAEEQLVQSKDDLKQAQSDRA